MWRGNIGALWRGRVEIGITNCVVRDNSHEKIQQHAAGLQNENRLEGKCAPAYVAAVGRRRIELLEGVPQDKLNLPRRVVRRHGGDLAKVCVCRAHIVIPIVNAWVSKAGLVE
jgi:hypothetical protein